MALDTNDNSLHRALWHSNSRILMSHQEYRVTDELNAAVG
jgi:hypothetical protein